ncbi:hypothetical protein PENTCL1PPCAC_22732, partial [Pristionchus entomophagus]
MDSSIIFSIPDNPNTPSCRKSTFLSCARSDQISKIRQAASYFFQIAPSDITCKVCGEISSVKEKTHELVCRLEKVYEKRVMEDVEDEGGADSIVDHICPSATMERPPIVRCRLDQPTRGKLSSTLAPIANTRPSSTH